MIRLALILAVQASLLVTGNFAHAQGSARDSLNDKGDSSAQQAGMLSNAGMLFTMTGTAMISTGTGAAYGKYLIGLGIASYAAGMLRSSQGGAAHRSADDLNPEIPTTPDLCAQYNVCPETPPPPPPPAVAGAPNTRPGNANSNRDFPGLARDDLNRLKNELEKAGIKTEEDRQKALAAGKAAGDSLGNPDPMSLLSASQKAEFERAMKAAAAKYGVSGVDTDGGGSASGLAHGKGSGKDDIDFSALFKKPEDDRSPASAAGLTKNFNGDPIGVAADDIFKQITRRYDAKKKSGQFMSINDVGAPGARKPNALLGPVKQKRH